MTGEYLRISTDNGATTREMRDTQATQDYINKLSFAHNVRVYFDTGEWYTIECGKSNAPRGMNDDGRSLGITLDAKFDYEGSRSPNDYYPRSSDGTR
jgi:hypothetical protein